MNKVIFNQHYRRLLFLALATALACMHAACKKEVTEGAPVITAVRNYAPSPADTLVSDITTGQWVVLIGHNLKNAVQISFNGIPATINSVMFSDTSATVLVPAVIPFPSVSAEDLNTIRYVTQQGATTFTFGIVAPPPTVASISNENANEGDSVYIYGLNLFFINEVTFAGTQITNYATASDGTSIGFVLPALTQSGPVVVTTKSGKASTPFNVNDATTGVLCDFDKINTFNWGTGVDNSSVNFPGNRGNYAVLSNGILPAGDGTWWDWQRSINTNDVQWVPADSLSLPLDEYALKFEISVPAAWTGTSIYVIKGYAFDYMARYEPWQGTNGAVSPFTTKGWHTVTIPLSMFRSNDGRGSAAASLTGLLGATGNGAVNIQTKNFSALPSASGLKAAIDNIRVVKIK
ncbi:glycan-binding surface protein [Chitinophaga filiformis]|uniref:glycan-binding surface protein n=1 Tax=Chitinophaga filiformis TaxID=104663 RepID=UPI001F16274D|nr:glycan-binding surface protein [Chitinophaga filiformis]MCF6407265.1 glycan-binding surface protein [Chitinophaga filiformis]